MTKTISVCFATAFCFATIFSYAQNPLINSGEIIQQGSKLHDEGKYKEAIALYSKISRSDTNYSKALYELSLSHYLDSNFIASRQFAQLGLQTFPEKAPEWYSLLATALDELGQQDSAIFYYDKALLQNPYDYSVLFNKGVVFYRQKKLKEAKECFQKAVLIYPYYNAAHYFLGLTAMQEGNLTPALLSFTTCLLINPQTSKLNGTITSLTTIAKAKDDIMAFVNGKKSSSEDNFDLQQEIILSKIALDDKYKLQTSLEDPIVRQLQVMLEKLEYNPDDKGFWMQFYVPFFQTVLGNKDFNVMVNYMFSGVNIKQVQDYNKRNKKEVEAFIAKFVAYFDEIKTTQLAESDKRKASKIFYAFKNGSVSGKGEWRKVNNELQPYGPWEFYYSTGQLKSKGILNNNQNKEGEWTFYNANGTIDEQTNYKNGELEGKRLSLYDNGLPFAEETYKDGLLEGLRNQYYYNGVLRHTELYTRGKKNGQSTGYDNSGYRYYTCNYVNDELDGELKYLHYNGKTATVTAYKAGKADGPYKKYNQQGVLIQEGAYVNDIANGIWKEYYDNGKPYKEYTYVLGKIEGEYKSWYNSGKPMETVLYVKGELNGKSAYFDEDGILYSDATYEKDRLREINFFDKTGKVLSSTTTRKGDANIVFYDANRIKTNQGSFTREGLRHGKSTYYYSNGEISAVAAYKDGNLQGEKILYYPGGTIQEKINYVDGDEDGYLLSYYRNGKLKTEGMFVEGDKQGEYKEYDALGNVTSNKYYLNNQQNGYSTYYHPNGKPDVEQFYDHDWLQSFVQFDTLGRVLTTVKLDKGKTKFTYKHFNGKDYIRGSYKNYFFDGPYEILFFDGTQNSMKFYKNGYADSIFRQYHYGGKLGTEGTFVHGTRHGDWKYYYRNGKLYLTEKYINGEQNGKEEMYNEDGTLMKEYNYLNDMMEGEHKIYGDNNEIALIINYHNDEAVSYTYLGKDGKYVAAIPLANGTGKVVSYYKNGTKSAEIDFVNGTTNGKRNFWFTNGKPYIEGTQVAGHDDGVKKTYSPNGQLVEDEIFVSGNLHGNIKYYYPTGKIRSEETWYNGDLHGTSKYYDELGKLQTKYYYFDILQSVK